MGEKERIMFMEDKLLDTIEPYFAFMHFDEDWFQSSGYKKNDYKYAEVSNKNVSGCARYIHVKLEDAVRSAEHTNDFCKRIGNDERITIYKINH